MYAYTAGVSACKCGLVNWKHDFKQMYGTKIIDLGELQSAIYLLV